MGSETATGPREHLSRGERALRVASLLVPAAMVRYGMKLALARSNARTIVVIGWDAISRLAACYGLASAADVALVGTEQELSSAAQLGLPRYVYARAADAIPLFSKLKRPTLFVLGTTALSDLARSVLDALASPADVRGLWIQCGRHQSSDNVTRLASPRLDVVSIPDPWNEVNLDVLSEAPSRFRNGHRRRVWTTRSTGCAWTVTSLRNAFRRKHSTSRPPTRARFMADLYGFEFCSTVVAPVVEDDATGCVFIVTDHQSHAELAAIGLRAGKYVFVEKPPAIDADQLVMLMNAVAANSGVLQVGYNRNFAPLVRRMFQMLEGVPGPTRVHVNRRPYDVARNSWYYWPKEGTRIVSNVCHFLDLSYQIAGRQQPRGVTTIHGATGRPDENAIVTATFADGSGANIVFSKRCSPKEYVSVRRGPLSLSLWNYSRLDAYKDGSEIGRWRDAADFGHAAEIQDFINGYRESRPQFYPPEDLAITSAMTFAARASLETGETVSVNCPSSIPR